MQSSISHATAQGSRSEQQDRYICTRIDLANGPRRAGHLLAILDGHGGQRTAEIAAEGLASVFEKSVREAAGRVDQALRVTFQDLVELTQKEPSGSTLSIVYVPDDKPRAYVGVLGDSPVIIQDVTGSLFVSPLHNARWNPPERAAAVARGAIYRGGYLEDPDVPDYGLQLSRALGDRNLARILNREPEIQRVELGNKSFILLASDGILDAFAPIEDQVKRLADLVQRGRDASDLVKDALQRRTGDNVTVIIWKKGS